jgi:uncharacterized protein (TIGR02597 family)
MKRTVTGCGSTLSKLTLVIALGVAVGLSTQRASAVDVFTDPVGFITMNVQGTNGLVGTSANSFIGLSMTQLPNVRGTITAINSNALTVGNALTPGQLAPAAGGPNPGYFVEILDGANPGLLDDVTGNDGTTIYTANDIAADIAGATTYKVYPHWTIGTVFGPANEAGLKAGTSAGAADNIKVFNPVAQTFKSYYFSSGGLAGVGWRTPGSSPASQNQSNVVLYVDQGILMVKNGSSSTDVKLVGGVKLGQTIVPFSVNNNFAGNVYAGTNTLGNSNLHNAGPASGSLVGATSAGVADNVKIFDPTTQTFTTYYWSTGGLSGIGWRRPGSSPASQDQSGVSFGIGQSLLIVRRPANGSMNWTAPMPYNP